MAQGRNSPQEKQDWDLGESTAGSTEGWRDSVGIWEEQRAAAYKSNEADGCLEK